MEQGTGRHPIDNDELRDLIGHRRRAISALLAKARKDDEESRELSAQLRELDAAVERGVESLSPEERQQLMTRCELEPRSRTPTQSG